MVRVGSFLLVVSALSGCCFGGAAVPPMGAAPTPGQPAPAISPAPVAAAPTPPPPPPEPAELLAVRDVQPLIERCLNRYSDPVLGSRQRYFSWADRERGPGGRHIYGLYQVSPSDVPQCRAAVTEVAQSQPILAEVDAAASAYATALEQVVPLIGRAYAYYERENYRDDDMAGGREMHPQLVDAFDAFEAAHRELDERVETISTAARELRLQQLEGDPARRGEYLVTRLMSQAQHLMELLPSVRVDGRRLVSDRQDELFAAIATLRTGCDEMYNERESAFAGFREGRNLLGPANELATSAVRLMRLIRDREQLSSFHLRNIGTPAGWMLDGGPDEVIREYNELVDAYNRM